MICVGIRSTAASTPLHLAILQKRAAMLIHLLLQCGWTMDRLCNLKLRHAGAAAHKFKDLLRDMPRPGNLSGWRSAFIQLGPNTAHIPRQFELADQARLKPLRTFDAEPHPKLVRRMSN
jgi:hypothetical protein